MKNQLINKPLLQLLLASGITAAATSPSAAVVQTSSEVWVGTSTTLQGNGGTGSKLSMFSKRMVMPIETAGAVSLVQNATLIDTNRAWTDSQYGANGVAAYVEFDNGWMADISDCSAANHSLTLAGGLGNAVAVGNAYRIHKHFTVNMMFGTNNEAGLKSGFNPLTSDNVLLEIPQTQQSILVFYYDDGTYRGWLDGNFNPAGNQVIYPEQGVMVRRRVATDQPLYLVGPVKTGSTVVTIDSGNNLVGTLKSATPMTLSGLNIYTGDPSTGLASGFNPTTSDNLLVFQPDGSTALYFYYKDPTYQGWLDGNFNPADAVQISPGAAFFVRRKIANSPFNWTIPAE